MPNPTRRIIALALLAAAIIAALVALDLASIAAQSDDEQAGRIVARRLDDGRTEFGWQPAGGERVLPRARYFPTNAQVGRWLNSSPVEVDGAEIGRINARLRSDGRIEFAFTPTDGERIAPPARYFPANARANRWLRSTEITISAAPATGFVAISAGDWHACAIRAESGEIACWGDNYAGQLDAPPGSFSAISAGDDYTCAIRAGSGAIECWGIEIYPAPPDDPPDDPYIPVSGDLACLVRESGAIGCWGGLGGGGATDAPAGSFTAVAGGYRHTCAIRAGSGEIACWGSNSRPGEAQYNEDTGEWTQPDEIYAGQLDAPPGRFIAVAAAAYYSCAIRDTGAIECWGWNEYGATDPPAP